MKCVATVTALTVFCTVLALCSALGQTAPVPTIIGVVTDKARYAPGEKIQLEVQVDKEGHVSNGSHLLVELQDCGTVVAARNFPVKLNGTGTTSLSHSLVAPTQDFHGYRISVRLLDASGHELANGASAVDVSSNWARFPRYGYVANYEAGTAADRWVETLNRYHINGLQFYDVQYKHHLPTPVGSQLPEYWPDVAGRQISRDTVLALLRGAKSRNMITMVYNASYAAYSDAFTDGSGVKLAWASWPDAGVERTAATVKSFRLPQGWATASLTYMNQADPHWRAYLFARMRELFGKLPFDGWHIDTYGDSEAWADDRSRIDFPATFPSFVNEARQSTGRPVVLNTVSGLGQAGLANSASEFIYSELWPEDHATYSSIVKAVDEIRAANPKKAIVFAAYLHRALAEKLAEQGRHTEFNVPSVLLADAVVFASGASHIELGDGDRMLSRPYFVEDKTISTTPELRAKLRDYYDFLVAYENHLQEGFTSASIPVSLSGARQTTSGEPGAVWTLTRHNDHETVLHLINLVGQKSDQWRDDEKTYPEPPALHDLRLRVKLDHEFTSAGWASPDIDHGAWHELKLAKDKSGEVEFVLPELHYWTAIIFRPSAAKR